MLGDLKQAIDNDSFKHEIAICKPNKEIVGYIEDYTNIRIKRTFGGIDELELTIPLHIENERGQQIKNPVWDKVVGDYLLLLDNLQYFIIGNPKLNSNGDTKTFVSYELQYELRKRNLREYKRETIPLWIDPLLVTEDKFGILNEIDNLHSWKIVDVDLDLMSTYRTVDFSDATLLDVFVQLQEIYDCVFLFNTLTREIKVTMPEKIGKHSGIILSDENLIEQFDQELKHDEIITRLFAYGSEDVDLRSLTPTMQPYIDDFSFYRNEKYMSKGLLQALDTYDQLVINNDGLLQEKNNLVKYKSVILFGDGSKSLQHVQVPEIRYIDENGVENVIQPKNLEYLTYANGLYGELDYLKTDLRKIETLRDLYIQLGEYGYTYNPQDITNAQNLVTAKENEINLVESEIDTIRQEIIGIGTSLLLENNLTKDQLQELNYFIKEHTYTNSSIINDTDLLEVGQKELAKLSHPSITFQANVLNFLRMIEYQNNWDKLILGDFVSVEYDKFGTYLDVRLITYEIVNYENINFGFSNTDSINDPRVFLQDLLKQTSTNSTLINWSKVKWDKAQDANNKVNGILESEWDSAKNAIVGGSNQQVAIDERGISLKSGIDDREQIRMINNVIAMTRDGWNTASLAITPRGIFAERLVGKIIAGQNLLIENTGKTFRVDENGVTLINGDISVEKEDGSVKVHISPDNGIDIEKKNGTVYEKVFYVDENGNLVLKGNVTTTGGTIEGKYVNAKGMSVKDANNNVTFLVDSNGNVTLKGNIETTGGIIKGQYVDAKGLVVRNANNQETFAIDSGGNVAMTGKLVSQNTNQRVEIDSDSFTSFDNNNPTFKLFRSDFALYSKSHANRMVSSFATHSNTNDSNITGMAITLGKDTGRFLSIGVADSNNIVGSYIATPYMKINNNDPNLNSVGTEGVHIFKDVNMNAKIINGLSGINQSGARYGLYISSLYLGGNNIYSDTVDGNVYINYYKGSHATSPEGWTFIGNNYGGYGALACKDFVASGSKNSIQDTLDYGTLKINAYETAEYYFGDIGSGQLANGECHIYIDDIFKQCINTDIEYQVFLSKYGQGDIWVEERNSNYFVVKGTSDIKFGWELKAKRLGYEEDRLERITLNANDNISPEEQQTISELEDMQKQDELNELEIIGEFDMIDYQQEKQLNEMWEMEEI